MDILEKNKQRIQQIQFGEPLRSPIIGDKSRLSEKAKQDIQKLVGPQYKSFMIETFKAWAVILGSVAAAVYAHNIFVSLIAIFLVATRQNVLGLLVHEQAHLLGFRSKAGELFANMFAAYPLLITVDGYAKVHLSHHNYYFTERDPDYIRKQGKEWLFNYRRRDLTKLILTDLSGLNTLKTLQGKRMSEDFLGPRKITTPKWVRLLYYALLTGLLTLTQTWGLFLIYWMLPLVTIMQVFVRWGAICEHKYNLLNPSISESTPLIKLSRWEKLLLPNLNFTLHIYHHYYPGIPFGNLPKVHAIFQRERMINELNVFRGYGSFLRYLCREHRVTGMFRARSGANN